MQSASIFAAAALLIAVSLVSLIALADPPGGRVATPPAVAALISGAPSTATRSAAQPSPTTNALAGLAVHAVGEVLDLRAKGRILDESLGVRGFWTDRSIAHSCNAPDSPPGELQIRCHDGEFGITERDEPIGTLTVDGRFLPHQGPGLTPFVDEALAPRLFTLPYINGQPYPPVPIVVTGHFDDPRADLCQPEARQLCRDRLVIDEIVEFDPQAVPTPGITPTPSPFPFENPPLAPFTAAGCAGDVPYSFVGWGRLSDHGLDIGPNDVRFLMVTRDEEEISGTVARWVCYAHEWESGTVGFATIP